MPNRVRRYPLTSRSFLRNRLGSFFTFVLLGAVTIFFLASGTQTPTAKSDTCELFGVGEPLTSREVWEGFDPQPAFENIRALGVKSLREATWMELLLVNETTLNVTSKKILDSVISNMTAINVTVMGMAQDFPNWMTRIYTTSYDPQIAPCRNLTSGSIYMNFLDRYRKSWQTLAKTFPSITVWEIGNEYNADPFLHPQGYNSSDSYSPRFSDAEKAEITTDLLYYGSVGIHSGNPNATTVLGGLSPGADLSEIAVFLNETYKNIESGRWPSNVPNDYFQIACWHPYLWTVGPNSTNWINPNQAIHQVMVNHGDSAKHVIFSEFGYNDRDNSQEDIANYLDQTFELARNSFLWLDTIYWFRLVDPNATSPLNPPGFGFFNLNWTWKPAAQTYQKIIPEYPTAIILPLLLLTATLVATLASKRRRSEANPTCSP